MKRTLAAIAAASVMGLGGGAAYADSISSVENARAKERAGYRLNGQDRESLRRYGGNADYGWRDGYRDYGAYDGPYGGGVSVYVGPRDYYYGSRGY